MKWFLTHRSERRFAPYVDSLLYLGGIAGPVVTLPQVVQIFAQQDAGGVSLFSWSAYLVGASIWFTYGLIHREKPILFFNALNIPIYAAVVLGTVLFA